MFVKAIKLSFSKLIFHGFSITNQIGNIITEAHKKIAALTESADTLSIRVAITPEIVYPIPTPAVVPTPTTSEGLK